MLARIRGSILALETNPPLVVLEPEGQPGLGYEVLLPAYLADQLMASGAGGIGGGGGVGGALLDLFTIQYLEGVNQGVSFIPRLIGFTSTRDRDFFELLTSVKGLGNKRALRAMALAPSSIARAITERDARFLQRLPEIGPKLAELIVHELKNKVDGFVTLDSPVAAPSAGEPATRVEPKPAKKSKGATTDTGAKAPAATPAATSHTAPQPAAPPIRQTIDALVALGESPIDAERMVNRAIDKARAAKLALPSSTQELLTAAYAARN